jgi:peroxiredoxin family protein
MSEATTNSTDTANPLDQAALRELIDRALDERAADDGYNKKNKITIVAWDGHLDRIWPTLILSSTAAASGMEVSVFFTFWGLFPLVKPDRRRKTPHPTELLELSREMGVRLIPCQMTMDLMGVKKEDLIDGLEEPIGAATALLEMKESAIQLFI